MSAKNDLIDKIKKSRKHLADRVVVQKAGSTWYASDALSMTRDTVIQISDPALTAQSVKFYRLYKELRSKPLVPEKYRDALTWLPSYRRDEILEAWLTRRNDLLNYYLARINITFEECEKLIKEDDELFGRKSIGVNGLPVSKRTRDGLKRLLREKNVRSTSGKAQQGIVYSAEPEISDELRAAQRKREEEAKRWREEHKDK